MKITIGNKTSEILGRKEAETKGYKFQIISSTESQPWVGINFIDGSPVGGRTMTNSQMEALKVASVKAGAKIEED